jgi:hypothetical protein
MVIYHIARPEITDVSSLNPTTRGDKGFGSTGNQQVPIINRTTAPTMEQLIQEDGLKPTQIWLSSDPFHHRIDIKLDINGVHPTLGIRAQPMEPYHHRLQLLDMTKGTPGHKLPWWRSILKRAIILTVDKHNVRNTSELESIVMQARQAGRKQITIQFATIQPQPLHPQEGSLMLHYDQLNIIAKHLQEPPLPPSTDTPQSVHDTSAVICSIQDQSIDQNDLGKSFTLKDLKKRPDWNKWQQARYTMLNSYHDQGMFGAPMEAPKHVNIHHMIWKYLIKMDGVRKACMVCDGSPRQGTITLGHTFANSVDATSERLFWAVVAEQGLIAYGADVSNAFAEAPPPVHPLYMRIDEAYRDWWENHLEKPPIPAHHTVVRVQNAIQGHPESSRLWEKLIDQILITIGFQPTTHEPCLYSGTINGHYTLFLRQVDDFAIATINEDEANKIIKQINTYLQLPIHNLGIITRYNGMDVEQTRHYIKIHQHKYLTKLSHSHTWIHDTETTNPIPFASDPKSLTLLLNCATPATAAEQAALEHRMGIKYRHLLGEILYPMVKCRPDISTHAILLSQFMNNPGEAHYIALKQLAQYLVATKSEGIHY